MRQVLLDVICDTWELLRVEGLLTTAHVHMFACGAAQQLALEVRCTTMLNCAHQPHRVWHLLSMHRKRASSRMKGTTDITAVWLYALSCM